MEHNIIKVYLFLCIKFSKIQLKTLFKISVEWKWKITSNLRIFIACYLWATYNLVIGIGTIIHSCIETYNSGQLLNDKHLYFTILCYWNYENKIAK